MLDVLGITPWIQPFQTRGEITGAYIGVYLPQLYVHFILTVNHLQKPIHLDASEFGTGRAGQNWFRLRLYR